MRQRVNRAEVDSGNRPGTSTTVSERIAKLERENVDLHRANPPILQAASVLFATEFDGRPKR